MTKKALHYTAEQQAIIEHSSGHALVNAVPGSGKTESLVARIAYLLEQKVDPRSIKVIMYNKSAATDFQRRLSGVVPPTMTLPDIRTFHSQGYEIIERLSGVLNLQSWELETNPRVSRALCRQVLKKHQQADDLAAVDTLQSIITAVKSRYDKQPTYQGRQDCDEMQWFHTFETLRKERQIRFFADLLYDSMALLDKHPELAVLFQTTYQHIIVDEYQDSNQCQQQLLKRLAGTKASMMVVGDVNQTIYEFIGSDPTIMLEQFDQDFTDARHYSLSRTFRFGSTLAKMANHLIANNKTRFRIECLPASKN